MLGFSTATVGGCALLQSLHQGFVQSTDQQEKEAASRRR